VVVVFHTSKAPGAPKAEQTDIIIGKENRTLDGFSSRRRLEIPKKTLKKPKEKNRNSPPTRDRGLPHLEGPKGTGGRADQQHHRQGEPNPRWVF
jgi:hypothetical protein